MHRRQNMQLLHFIPQKNMIYSTKLFQLVVNGVLYMASQTLILWHSGGLLKWMEKIFSINSLSIFQPIINHGVSTSRKIRLWWSANQCEAHEKRNWSSSYVFHVLPPAKRHQPGILHDSTSITIDVGFDSVTHDHSSDTQTFCILWLQIKHQPHKLQTVVL